MQSKRGKFSAAFKDKVVLVSAGDDRTIAELAGEFCVHPNQTLSGKSNR